jgi:SAM-dependent methyltransferase
VTDRVYVFDGTEGDAELRRLLALEEAFDEGSRRWLLRTGVAAGWRCLEVGAGAGSIARWMGATVGDSGQVVAVDLDPRFLQGIEARNVRVLEADVRAAPLAAASFDLVHARFVLIHMAGWEAALEAMLRTLRPGGWLVLEEPDFAAARALAGPPEMREGVGRVNEAIERMFTARGMDHAFGARIPALLERRALQRIEVEDERPVAGGGGIIATMMGMSARQLADKYVATGRASARDVDLYCAFAADPSSQAIYHGVARGLGRTAGREARLPPAG